MVSSRRFCRDTQKHTSLPFRNQSQDLLCYCMVFVRVCVQIATCQDVLPISSPGKKFKCPAGMQYNPTAGVKVGPTTSVCCVVGCVIQQQ